MNGISARNDDGFGLWYPVRIAKQLSLLDEKEYDVEIIETGHIVHNGVLLCGESREVLKSRAKATKEKNLPTRVPHVPVCPACQELYKNNPESAWYQFVQGQAIRVVGIEVISKDVPVEVAESVEVG